MVFQFRECTNNTMTTESIKINFNCNFFLLQSNNIFYKFLQKQVIGFPDNNRKNSGSEHLIQVGSRDNGKEELEYRQCFHEFCCKEERNGALEGWLRFGEIAAYLYPDGTYTENRENW